jgi:ribosomal-protein-alanine N-acetyltransferase
MVTLRSLASGDVDAVHALISRMDVVRHMRFSLCSTEESQKFLRDSLLESPSDPWRSIVRAISDSPRSDLVGLCGVVILRGAEEGEIWYLVEPESWGKGIASQAVKHLLDFGFGELRLHRIWATCLPENPASARVLEKVGMRKEGFLVKNLKIHGEWKSSFLYAMLAEEWSRTSSNLVTESGSVVETGNRVPLVTLQVPPCPLCSLW